jgi:heme/copper-type cytochrome/quinol oxidase subunit 2
MFDSLRNTYGKLLGMLGGFYVLYLTIPAASIAQSTIPNLSGDPGKNAPARSQFDKLANYVLYLLILAAVVVFVIYLIRAAAHRLGNKTGGDGASVGTYLGGALLTAFVIAIVLNPAGFLTTVKNWLGFS